MNFVIHRIKLSSLVSILDESYRFEGSSTHPSPWCGLKTASLITRVKYKYKIFRIKQFLYDLGPSSTFGLGAFFDFYPWAIKVIPLSDNKAAWYGHDNKGRAALGFLSYLTCIQISAENKEQPYDVKDFIYLANHLECDALNSTSFAERSYWSRCPNAYEHLTLGSYAIPTSLWKLRWPIPNREAHVLWSSDTSSIILDNWHSDSKYLKKSNNEIIESGELFIPNTSPAHQIVYRRTIWPNNHALKKPKEGQAPSIDPHSGFAKFVIATAKSTSTNYFIASCTSKHGPHDAISWNDKGQCLLIQASSMWGFSLARFQELLSSFQQEEVVISPIGNIGH